MNLMNDNELLQAISEMMDKKLEPIQKDICDLNAGQLKVNIFLENDIDKKLSALFDGHALSTEKIEHISETVDDIDAAMTAVDIVTKANIKEINKLKTKIG
jgi:hypothetical protein